MEHILQLMGQVCVTDYELLVNGVHQGKLRQGRQFSGIWEVMKCPVPGAGDAAGARWEGNWARMPPTLGL